MYQIKNFREEVALSIEDNKKDDSTSLTFFGKGSNYGLEMNQNMLRLMEHFASSEINAPKNKVLGQLWFNLDKKSLNVWNGFNWTSIKMGGPKSLIWDKTSFTQTIDTIYSLYKDKITVKGINCTFKNILSSSDYTISSIPQGLSIVITVDIIKNEAYIELSGKVLKNLLTTKFDITFKESAFTNVINVADVSNNTNNLTIPFANVVDKAPTGSVTLSGKGEVDEILTVTNDLNDADTMGTISYEWYIDGVKLSSNTGKNTYKILKADATKIIKVKAVFKDGLNNSYNIESNGISVAALPVPSLDWTVKTAFAEKIDNDGTFEGNIEIAFNNCKASSTFDYTKNDIVAFTNIKDIDGKVATISDIVITKDPTSTDTLLKLKIVGKSSEPEKNNTSTLSINPLVVDDPNYINGTSNITITMKATPLYVWDLNISEINNDGTFEGSVIIDITNGTFDTSKTIAANNTTALILSNVKDGTNDITITGFKQKSNATITTSKISMIVMGKVTGGIDKDIMVGTLTLQSEYVKDNNKDIVYNETSSLIVALGSNNPVAGNVTIKGLLNVGENLTIEQNLTDVDGLGTFSYQWYKDNAIISGATLDNYTVAANDLNHNITVKISYTDGKGTAEEIYSPVVTIVEKESLITWGTGNFAETSANDGTISGKILVTLPSGFGYVTAPSVTIDKNIGVSPTVVRKSASVLEISLNGVVSSTYANTDFTIAFTIDSNSITAPIGQTLSNYTSDNYNVDMNETIPVNIAETFNLNISKSPEIQYMEIGTNNFDTFIYEDKSIIAKTSLIKSKNDLISLVKQKLNYDDISPPRSLYNNSSVSGPKLICEYYKQSNGFSQIFIKNNTDGSKSYYYIVFSIGNDGSISVSDTLLPFTNISGILYQIDSNYYANFIPSSNMLNIKVYNVSDNSLYKNLTLSIQSTFNMMYFWMSFDELRCIDYYKNIIYTIGQNSHTTNNITSGIYYTNYINYQLSSSKDKLYIGTDNEGRMIHIYNDGIVVDEYEYDLACSDCYIYDTDKIALLTKNGNNVKYGLYNGALTALDSYSLASNNDSIPKLSTVPTKFIKYFYKSSNNTHNIVTSFE